MAETIEIKNDIEIRKVLPKTSPVAETLKGICH